MPTNKYDRQAARFLRKRNLVFSATKVDAGRCPPYCDGKHIHGDEYRVTLLRAGQHERGKLTFSFWDSLHARETGATLRAYAVLACLNSDVDCPDTFADFCEEYGYDPDSRKAFRSWERCRAFAERLRAFFTAAEVEDLGLIR